MMRSGRLLRAAGGIGSGLGGGIGLPGLGSGLFRRTPSHLYSQHAHTAASVDILNPRVSGMQMAPPVVRAPVPELDVGLKFERCFSVSEILQTARATDVVLSMQEPNRTSFSYGFIAGLSTHEMSQFLLTDAQGARMEHIVIGRDDVACDFYGDCDLPLSIEKSVAEQRVAKAIRLVQAEYKKKGADTDRVVVLSGQSTTKHSFHVHIGCTKLALKDYVMAGHIASRVNEAMQCDVFDAAVYRKHGTIRLFGSVKSDALDRPLVPYTPETGELAALVRHDDLSDADFLEISMVQRSDAQEKGHVITELMCSEREEFRGESEHTTLTAQKRQKLTMVALKALKRMPDFVADRYPLWSAVGLALCSMDSQNNYFHFMDFSRRCPEKFNEAAVAKHWKKYCEFQSRPESKSTFLLGFNTIMKTYRNAKSGRV